jgi:hypothetical protein
MSLASKARRGKINGPRQPRWTPRPPPTPRRAQQRNRRYRKGGGGIEKMRNLLLFTLSVVESLACAGPDPVWAELAWFWPDPPPELPPEDILRRKRKTELNHKKWLFWDFTEKRGGHNFHRKLEEIFSFGARRFSPIDNHEQEQIFGLKKTTSLQQKFVKTRSSNGARTTK